MPRRVLILGAAGRDFHDFNVLFRDDPEVEVVGFTAAQIPNIEERRYPPQLAGSRYPQGIPIYPEEELERLITDLAVEQAVFAYSDVSHEHVMHLAARVVAAGAEFVLPGDRTLLESPVPVVAVTAVRTGSGKSPTSRAVRRLLTGAGKRVAVVRHPMPYGDLIRQRLQRFAAYEDLERGRCTIEEREEYEPHIAEGSIVFAGVDYEAILEAAAAEADVILWDGGNNDLPFFRPTLHICVVDPHRAGHELRYWPGEANLRRADVVIVNKVDSAAAGAVAEVLDNVAFANPEAVVVQAASPITVEAPELIEGRRVLVVEDGPTLTHGEMAYGAGVLAARRHGAAELIDPRPHAVGSIAATFAAFPHVGTLLPAMGYGEEQIAELAETIRRADPDTVVVGTPIDLMRLVDVDVPSTRVSYDLEVVAGPSLDEILRPVL